ncbi:MAG: twin-arginine translocation signal domain-containing protein [Coriobacteriales bacterium]|nr:twin-arginine translocation signal domain-containing protein [Coriobacteriales bacterium]
MEGRNRQAISQGRSSSISRRRFVQAAAASATALAIAGCSPENRLTGTEAGTGKVYRLDIDLDENIEGKWIPVACWLNCLRSEEPGNATIPPRICTPPPSRISIDSAKVQVSSTSETPR